MAVKAKRKVLELNEDFTRTKEWRAESKFFTDGSQPKATSGGVITVGTECSGMFVLRY